MDGHPGELFEHEYCRHFKVAHNADAHLGTLRFGHLPVGSFLALLPKDEPPKMFQSHVEIRSRAYELFDDLLAEKEALPKAVASLNTVWLKVQFSVDFEVKVKVPTKEKLTEVKARIPTKIWAGDRPQVPTKKNLTPFCGCDLSRDNHRSSKADSLRKSKRNRDRRET
ncbi:hypothetical protein C8F04DRAFT_1188746 [Mycena alexandri]|uniref:Uncharacterized protein n=1 Tax=Mycena alexandri TaxID=1745969 RepID=A0AAD6SMI7_9AGAR|nr:hypothetical protein C8F04DRAFT_1188746 [Mycena alexandri]